MKKAGIIVIFLFFLAAGLFFYQQEREARYKGQSFIPERSEDVPLYAGLKPDGSPEYIIEGNHWEEILNFYKKKLPENGWEADYIQKTDVPSEDGAGFISRWTKLGEKSELWIGAGYFQNLNQTEVIFDKHQSVSASVWIEDIPNEICINEQPDRSNDCFKMTDQSAIHQIAEMVNNAINLEKEPMSLDGKSTIEFGSLQIDVYYDLEKGIYLVSEKGKKIMKPEKEFFELTRISKEY